MSFGWVFVVACACTAVCVSDASNAPSLRGALEALQRRQRADHEPHPPDLDYEALYDALSTKNLPDSDYGIDNPNIPLGDPRSKYVLNLLNENDRPRDHQYKIDSTKYSRSPYNTHKGSVFRERIQQSNNAGLDDIFAGKNEKKLNRAIVDNNQEGDDYEVLLQELWSKYKNKPAHANNFDSFKASNLHHFKVVNKRYPNNWGPIAFKRKRSPDQANDSDKSVNPEYESNKKPSHSLSNDNTYDTEDDGNDIHEEYAIAFQPLDEENPLDVSEKERYAYETDKQLPISKRSGSSGFNTHEMHFTNINKEPISSSKKLRSQLGTDPKLLKELSMIFGKSTLHDKNPVKRSSELNKDHNEYIPPKLTVLEHNGTHMHLNTSIAIDGSHEQHAHNMHHPGFSGKDVEIDISHDHQHLENNKPVVVRKKSIDWSDYFGINKRKNNLQILDKEKLRKEYFDLFKNKVTYPLKSFREHKFVKRTPQNTENEENLPAISETENKRSGTISNNDAKLQNFDEKLKNMEDFIVDEAMHTSHSTGVGDELDSKEEQQIKDKVLSQLATAYSLEKMRKAIKDFKQTIKSDKPQIVKSSPIPYEESKVKRVYMQKENEPAYNIPNNIYDFEDEQGAGHYVNGINEDLLSERYVGGSGRHRSYVVPAAESTGSCPVLGRIVNRCRGVDLLAGDRGQMFLPLCSLHQICYLCGGVPLTTCDLVFLSEADSMCEGEMDCQRAARSALMTLRELHDNLADEMDGECEASPCLLATMKLNVGWQRALH